MMELTGWEDSINIPDPRSLSSGDFTGIQFGHTRNGPIMLQTVTAAVAGGYSDAALPLKIYSTLQNQRYNT
jgi:hypothetical protein